MQKSAVALLRINSSLRSKISDTYHLTKYSEHFDGLHNIDILLTIGYSRTAVYMK